MYYRDIGMGARGNQAAEAAVQHILPLAIFGCLPTGIEVAPIKTKNEICIILYMLGFIQPL